jgi:hypothetical protein
MASKTASPSIELAEELMEKVLESADKFRGYFEELKRSDPASERFFDLLSELWAEAEVLRTKAAHSKQETDALMDYLGG